MNHGTAAGYVHGCRCDDCRIAHAKAQAAFKSRNMETGRQPPVHGTVNGYVNYGCRCDECRSAGNAQRRAHKQRRRAS